MATAVSIIVLAAVLGLVAWGRLPDAIVALAGVAIVLALGLVSLDDVGETLDRLGSTLGFLAAIFVVAEVAREAGLFDAAGVLVARRAGSPRALVLVVSAVVIVVTVFLSLDATAVLFTPVVIHVVRLRGAEPERPLLATAQLANASSSLLPVSNLTNLLVFPATGLTCGGFAFRMALPTLAAVGVVVAVAARGSSRDRSSPAAGAVPGPAVTFDRFAWFAAGAIALLMVAFFVGSAVGIEPVWIAAGGALVLGVGALATRRTRPVTLAGAASPLFLVFVAGLAVVVDAAVRHGLGDAARAVLPSGEGLGALLLVAVVAAVLANLANNVPATLVLASVVPAHAVGQLLAVLVGVNVGPNLTYTGSLATLLWRRSVRGARVEPSRGSYFRFALLATPPALVLATAMLWVTLQVTG